MKFFVFLVTLFVCASLSASAWAALSFCNRTNGTIEAAVGYRDSVKEDRGAWISEGWWRIEPGQCARVYADPLSQRFYFYYAHALAAATHDTPSVEWGGKYAFCIDSKAFRAAGDESCASRHYQSAGFQELDVGPNTRDYTLDFREGGGR